MSWLKKDLQLLSHTAEEEWYEALAATSTDPGLKAAESGFQLCRRPPLRSTSRGPSNLGLPATPSHQVQSKEGRSMARS